MPPVLDVKWANRHVNVLHHTLLRILELFFNDVLVDKI